MSRLAAARRLLSRAAAPTAADPAAPKLFALLQTAPTLEVLSASHDRGRIEAERVVLLDLFEDVAVEVVETVLV